MSPGPELRAELEQLGERAAEDSRRRDRARCFRAGWLGATTALWIVPAVAFTVSLLLGQSGLGFTRFWPLATLTFAFAIAVTISRARRAFDRSIGTRDGLARLDRELDARGRLQAAHEFLGTSEPSPFMLAAIEDAGPFAERAREHRLQPPARDPLPARAWITPLASLGFCALLAWLAPELGARVGPGTAGELVAAAPEVPEARRERLASPSKELAPAPPPRETETKPAEDESPSTPEERALAREPERDPKPSSGKTGSGRSTQATPASSSSTSRGFLSTQSQPSSSGDPGKPSTKKPKPPKNDDQPPSERKKIADPSGATAGTGVGSGSSKNPGSTDWTSKDQVATDEEPPLGEDEDVDDDDDESEARGGLQPSLRDRKPAVNRDLTIGFGNQLNPDANGRGGPSERKKSRGVASLVLGVPIPDHVKGQPNPGRTKITQERVEPRSEESAPVAAQARAPRAGPIGPLSSPELAPWMRELVRGYFLNLRRNTKG